MWGWDRLLKKHATWPPCVEEKLETHVSGVAAALIVARMSNSTVGLVANVEVHRARGAHISASVVAIVVILSAVLILSAVMHLLARRCLGRHRPAGGHVPGGDHGPLVSALHGQLQHLFHLHDTGVEQAFIDTMPVFAYASIRGLKDGTDCAVCLTEFGDDDRLRLLPKCKHAFHRECIDTWLLANSTCPLCRRALLPDASLSSGSRRRRGEPQLPETTTADMVHSNQLEIDAHMLPLNTSRRAVASLQGSVHGRYRNSFRVCDALPSSDRDSESPNEIQEEIEGAHDTSRVIHHEVELVQTPSPSAPTIRVTDAHGTQHVLRVELGRVITPRKGNSASCKLTPAGARSYSMGSYEYVVDPSSWELRIAPTPYPGRPSPCNRPTHRSALSDSIPELSSGLTTPANDALFWASRGLYNPHTLSRVRELLTPTGSDSAHALSPCTDRSSHSPGQGHLWIDIDIAPVHRCVDIDIEERAIPIARTSSLSQLPGVDRTPSPTRVNCFRRSLSAGIPDQAAVSNALLLAKEAAATSAAAREDSSTKPGSSSSRRFSFNRLVGRDKRMVFAAASPCPGLESEPPPPPPQRLRRTTIDLSHIPQCLG